MSDLTHIIPENEKERKSMDARDTVQETGTEGKKFSGLRRDINQVRDELYAIISKHRLTYMDWERIVDEMKWDFMAEKD